MTDPIVDEVRAIRAKIAEECGYDLKEDIGTCTGDSTAHSRLEIRHSRGTGEPSECSEGKTRSSTSCCTEVMRKRKLLEKQKEGKKRVGERRYPAGVVYGDIGERGLIGFQMTDEDFETRWLEFDRSELDREWFASLQQFYRACTPAQRTMLQNRLGWNDASCREPDNVFAANIGDRIRPRLRDEESFRQHLLALANGAWLEDYRDTLCNLAALYPVAILRGFDIDQILESVARECAIESAATIRGYLARPDKDLHVWRLRASRDSKRHIQIEHL